MRAHGILVEYILLDPHSPADGGPVIIATDLEGVLVPEIWERIAEQTGIAELTRTTRDEPDFSRLMEYRLKVLNAHGLRLPALQAIAAKMEPYPGAVELLEWMRDFAQVLIVSDSFHELSEGLVRRMGGFSLFANRFEVTADGRIEGVRLRIRGRKDHVIRSVQEIGFRVLAIGDSYNDERVLRSADHAILYNAPADLAERLPQAFQAKNYDDIRRFVEEVHDIDEGNLMRAEPAAVTAIPPDAATAVPPAPASVS
jgi:phosphoserine/homoserine phosphotransferase